MLMQAGDWLHRRRNSKLADSNHHNGNSRFRGLREPLDLDGGVWECWCVKAVWMVV